MAVKQVIQNRELRNGCGILIVTSIGFVAFGLFLGWLLWG